MLNIAPTIAIESFVARNTKNSDVIIYTILMRDLSNTVLLK